MLSEQLFILSVSRGKNYYDDIRKEIKQLFNKQTIYDLVKRSENNNLICFSVIWSYK